VQPGHAGHLGGRADVDPVLRAFRPIVEPDELTLPGQVRDILAILQLPLLERDVHRAMPLVLGAPVRPLTLLVAVRHALAPSLRRERGGGVKFVLQRRDPPTTHQQRLAIRTPLSIASGATTSRWLGTGEVLCT